MLKEEMLNVLNKYKNPNINELELISKSIGLDIDVIVEYYINKLSQVGDIDEGEKFDYN